MFISNIDMNNEKAGAILFWQHYIYILKRAAEKHQNRGIEYWVPFY